MTKARKKSRAFFLVPKPRPIICRATCPPIVYSTVRVAEQPDLGWTRSLLRAQMADCKRRSAVWQFFARHDIGFKKLARGGTRPSGDNIAQIIVSSSFSRKSRSSYPYKLSKPVFGPRPDYKLRVSRQLSRRPQPWIGLRLTCSCPSAGPRPFSSERSLFSQRPHFWARGKF